MNQDISCRILLITGELSGDLYGHLLIKRIREINPAFHFLGIGGPRIRSLGIEVLFSSESLSLVGLPGPRDLKKYWFVYKKIEDILKRKKVDVVILVDFPGFNLRIAKLARKLGYPVIYYVAPQVWAWHRRRINILRNCVDRLYVILPFEENFFSRYGIKTIFLGHPILDLLEVKLAEELFYEVYGFRKDFPLISFFPGSREGEVKRHIPLFLKIFEELKEKIPHVQGIMVKAESLEESPLWETARGVLKVIEGSQYEVLKYSTVAVLASGTITLESALLQTPAVVTYSLPSWMIFLAKKLVKVPYISLANLILEKEVYPEVVEEKRKRSLIVEKVVELVKKEEKRKKMQKELHRIKEIIGSPGASWRIAEDIVKFIYELKKREFGIEVKKETLAK